MACVYLTLWNNVNLRLKCSFYILTNNFWSTHCSTSLLTLSIVCLFSPHVWQIFNMIFNISVHPCTIDIIIHLKNLRCNWHMTYDMFQVYNIMLWYNIDCKKTMTRSLVVIHHHVMIFFLVMGTFKISLSSFQIYI